MIAPIALFVYNRPDHAIRTIEALKSNQLALESDLYVFSDGPKTETAAQKVAEVRSLLTTITGFRTINVVMRERNYGLAQSIIAGVTEVVSTHGKVIVIEDDMVTSPYFLRYMNDALDLYEHDDDVISIHGYVYPVKSRLPETFFLRGADCWGWGTWKQSWEMFEPDGSKLLSELQQRGLESAFDFEGTQGYTEMLKLQIAGSSDSWAVRWYASAFLRGKLTLYPGVSFVQNVGLDFSGTHCSSTTVHDVELATTPLELKKIAICEDANARITFAEYFASSTSSLKRMLKLLLGDSYFKWRCLLRRVYNQLPGYGRP